MSTMNTKSFFDGALDNHQIVNVIKTETVDLVVDSACIGWIILDNKKRSVNVLNLQMMNDMHQILSEVDKYISDKQVRVIVFWSNKSTFMVGADVHGIYQVLDEKLATDASRTSQRLYDRIHALKVPTIAAFNGTAMGGGLELGLACTYRVCSSSRKIQLGLPEVKLGLIPGAGGTVRLPQIIGLQNALQMILTGNPVDPSTAKKMGLVDELFEYEDRYKNENRFFSHVRRFAIMLIDKKIRREFKSKDLKSMLLNGNWIGRSFIANMALKNLNKTTNGRYPAPYKALESVMYSFSGVEISKALDFEAQKFGQCAVSPESKNLISIFFMQDEAKKIPKNLREIQSFPIQKISVIGAGVMGSGIVQSCAYKGYKLYMKDIRDEFVQNGMKNIKNLFQNLYKKGKISKMEHDEKLKLISYGISNDGLKGSNLIIEAALEKMEIKKQILKECEDVLDNDFIFATNTSTLSINEIAIAAKNPHNVIGMHFFNPVHKMPLVEIIRGKETSDAVVKSVYELALSLGKTPVVVNDGPGFLVNRILGIYMSEAGRMLAEGCDIKHIDKVIYNFGMPMGPFRLMDEVGLDVALHSAETLKVLGPRFENVFLSQLGKAIEIGMKGKKSGAGFYLYKDGKSTGEINPKFNEILGQKANKKLDEDEVVDRCILIMINEATLILEEKIAQRPEDIDLAMVMGTGFAPFRGGLLSFADYKGAKNIVRRLTELSKTHGMRFKPSNMLLKMAHQNLEFFPNRPKLVYVERRARL